MNYHVCSLKWTHLVKKIFGLLRFLTLRRSGARQEQIIQANTMHHFLRIYYVISGTMSLFPIYLIAPILLCSFTASADQIMAAKITRGIDFPHNDITALRGLSVEECKNRCVSTNGCLGAHWDNTCWLKHTLAGIAQPAGGYFIEIIPFQIFYDSDNPFNDIANLSTTNPSACADQCAGRPDCVSFHYDAYVRHCWLKNRVGKIESGRRGIVGIKRY